MSDSESSEQSRVLFCPFCRECYEGEDTCPEHELTLVEFSALPRRAHERSAVGWETPLPWWSPQLGRWQVALGILISVVSFFLPLVEVRVDEQVRRYSALQAALGPAANLWTIPFVAAIFAMVLYRRRTALDMRGARLVCVILSWVPVLILLYSAFNIRRGAQSIPGAFSLQWSIGGAGILLASGLLFWGSVILGRLPKGEEPEE